jgi:hypothetical protein
LHRAATLTAPADTIADLEANAVKKTAGRWIRGGHHLFAAAVAVLALATPVLAPAQNVMLTLLEGDADVFDGARRLAALPGLRLAPAAIVDTGPETRLVRLEWPDETVVDLGPATRVMVVPPGFAKRDGQAPLIYLLQGWAKVTSRGSAAAAGVVAPALELRPFSGAAVLFIDGREPFVFAESGHMDVLERPGGSAPLAVAAGALYTGSGTVQPRAGSEWLHRVPRSFRDPIPLRAAAFKDHRVEASVLPPPAYAGLADWLGAEPQVRREFPQRFRTLAQNAAFRRELEAHLPAHPEWVLVLHPPPLPQ